ncbi:CLUMA_CG002382, isoform A [Clunio marinus]|uniref:CLUMA_CG002382, isoform A n=1 Tax=Clunio marinus TaxID=568069 RepID=A0A1J1HKW8_9DIPT|nr:CLUMA_CG002382, isoform A [Clunio marinus]
MKIFALLLVVIATANCAELRCTYKTLDFVRPYYECDGRVTTSASDFEVSTVQGDHEEGKGMNDIIGVVIRDCSLEKMPRKLGVWFRNFREFGLFDIQNFPNFQRVDFSEYRQLRVFRAKNLRQVTRVPKDTFFDLTALEELYLDNMVNMENLDGDLLMNLRGLRVFSAQGPNKIKQISRGFFDNQSRTLSEINFQRTNLKRITYTIFNLRDLTSANFVGAGCLDKWYQTPNMPETLFDDIRNKCQDTTNTRALTRANYIVMNESSSSESSSD